MDNETGLGYDAGTGMFDALDEWWNRKIAVCPDAKTFKMYGLPNRDLLNIMFEGTVATGRNVFCTSGPIPTKTNEGSGDSADSVEFVDPQCEPVVNVDAMEVEGPSSLRAGPAVNKGKCLESKSNWLTIKRAVQLLVEDTDTAKAKALHILSKFTLNRWKKGWDYRCNGDETDIGRGRCEEWREQISEYTGFEKNGFYNYKSIIQLSRKSTRRRRTGVVFLVDFSPELFAGIGPM
nr:hypothetical protein CFP56_17058 [Quercus suber]